MAGLQCRRRLLTIGVLAVAVVGCGTGSTDTTVPDSGPQVVGPASPEAIVEGALRAQVASLVAPETYRSGLLPSPLASVWITRSSTEYRRWYAGKILDQSLLGLRNVVTSLTTTTGPIVAEVDIQRLDIGPVVIEGDAARADEASIWYVTHFAPRTWHVSEVDGVTTCRLELRQANSVWRVVDGTCNVGGG